MSVANKSTSFSYDVCASNRDDCLDLKVERIGHPIIKQIVSRVLAEDSGDMSLGSQFGEGQEAG